MINLRNVFNTNYNIIFITLTTILFILLILLTKDLKHIGKILIYTSISLIIVALISPLAIKLLNNNLIALFLSPIIKNIKINIIITSSVITIMGIILILAQKKNKKLT